MKIKFDNNITFKDFNELVFTQSKSEKIQSLTKEIEILEKKYNMKSSDFYKKYYKDYSDENEDYEFWYTRILMYSRYENIYPENVRI